jgi:hypothetical protein
MLYDPKKWPMPEVIPVEPKVEPWRQLLLGAADLIEKKGWCREDFENHGRYCAIGALNKVAGYPADPGLRFYDPTYSDARRKAEKILEKHLKLDDCDGVVEWNDGLNRNGKKIVIQALREAAKS